MYEDLSNHCYILEYGDNGKGISDEFDIKKTNTLGLQLVYGLTQQLKGAIDLQNNNGAKIKIVFKDNSKTKESEAKMI
ncbi:MAG TPA: hypothetical protein VLB82_05890 [Thermodesulfobacteriota bacterium]|nr:hypothetical protein [Thermodesulfobacteriota bacterium]